MIPRQKPQCQFEHYSKNNHSPLADHFKNPIIKVSMAEGVVLNRLESFWIRQTCETLEKTAC